MVWLMFTPCIDLYGFNYIKAEPPCNKGELSLNILRLSITLGWNRNK